MSVLYTVIGIALFSAVAGLFVKQYKPELAIIFSLGAGAVILIVLIVFVGKIADELRNIFDQANINTSVFAAFFKAMGICYLAKFATDVCKDFGQNSLAGKIELAGKICVALVTLPLVREILKVALELIG